MTRYTNWTPMLFTFLAFSSPLAGLTFEELIAHQGDNHATHPHGAHEAVAIRPGLAVMAMMRMQGRGFSTQAAALPASASTSAPADRQKTRSDD